MTCGRTGTTEMVEAGVGMAQIMSVTGHANPASVKPYMKNTAKKCKSCIDGKKNACYKHTKCRKRKVYNMYKYNNTNVYKYVSDLNIPNGSTKRMECPNCGERTLYRDQQHGFPAVELLSCHVRGQGW